MRDLVLQFLARRRIRRSLYVFIPVFVVIVVVLQIYLTSVELQDSKDDNKQWLYDEIEHEEHEEKNENPRSLHQRRLKEDIEVLRHGNEDGTNHKVL